MQANAATGLRLFKTRLCAKTVINFMVSMVLVVSCLLAVTAVFSNVRNSLIDENYTSSSSKPVPMGWELFVGGDFETKGVWSGKDAAAYYPHDTEMSDQELYDYRVALINERYDWYKENPTRYLHHLARKVTNLWGPYKDSIGRAQKYTENPLLKKLLKKVKQ